ncbi:hypothetical protein [Shouchella shacheensis]|uniref:hypothetical protein n=1 Tax=Shouchella shacheensis TaxID=1649580 RepID=UPI0007405444|nr:hypothetical protein [Shouchella shacheensis]
MNKSDLAKWYQEHKSTASLLSRSSLSSEEAWPVTIRQTAFPDLFIRSSAQGADTPADHD